jgi:hypothetical protein
MFLIHYENSLGIFLRVIRSKRIQLLLPTSTIPTNFALRFSNTRVVLRQPLAASVMTQIVIELLLRLLSCSIIIAAIGSVIPTIVTTMVVMLMMIIARECCDRDGNETR